MQLGELGGVGIPAAGRCVRGRIGPLRWDRRRRLEQPAERPSELNTTAQKQCREPAKTPAVRVEFCGSWPWVPELGCDEVPGIGGGGVGGQREAGDLQLLVALVRMLMLLQCIEGGGSGILAVGQHPICVGLVKLPCVQPTGALLF